MSSQLEIVKGDLLKAPEEYILQQCNCLTVRAHGLSATLASKYPWADPYGDRKGIGSRNLAVLEDRPHPGTIKICQGSPNVICLFGQHRPGKFGVSYWNSYPESNPPESPSQRLFWFRQGLKEVGEAIRGFKRPDRVGIALPYQIGCGLAGGEWEDYLRALEVFAEEYREVLFLKVYKL